MTRRPPSFPPAQPRQRPTEVAQELHNLSGSTETSPASEEAPHPPAEPAVSNRLAERLEELRAAKSRARKKRIGIIAGAVLLLAALIWVVAGSPLLALDLQDVQVEGATSLVTEDDVRERLAEHEGIPLARLGSGAIRDALLEDFAIKDAEVARAWPTGLHIRLQVRTPVAATPTDEGYTILDGDGAELGHSAEEPEGLPVINLGEETEELATTISAVLEVMDALPADLLEQVETVGADGPDEVKFTLESGSSVLWGNAEDSDLKASVLEVLLEVPADLYNVASPLSPITS